MGHKLVVDIVLHVHEEEIDRTNIVQQPDHICPVDKSELAFGFYIH